MDEADRWVTAAGERAEFPVVVTRLEISDSHLGLTFSLHPQGTLGNVSGDTFGCHNLWRGERGRGRNTTQRETVIAPTSFPTCCFNNHRAYNSGAVSTRTMLCTPHFTPKRDLVPIKRSLSVPLLQPLRICVHRPMVFFPVSPLDHPVIKTPAL